MQIDFNKVHYGDCAIFISGMPDNYIDLIISDCPLNMYNGGIMKTKIGESAYNMNKLIPYWLFDCFRILKHGGIFICFIPSSQLYDSDGYECIVRDSLRSAGFTFTDRIFFCNYQFKNKPVTKEDILSNHGFCFVFSKGEPIYYENRKLLVSFDENIDENERSIKLMEGIIKNFTKEGMIILDLCAGSACCGEASIKLNRKYVGFEIEEDRCIKANERIIDG